MVIGQTLGFVARRENRLLPVNTLEGIERNRETEELLAISVDLMEYHFLMRDAHHDTTKLRVHHFKL